MSEQKSGKSLRSALFALLLLAAVQPSRVPAQTPASDPAPTAPAPAAAPEPLPMLPGPGAGPGMGAPLPGMGTAPGGLNPMNLAQQPDELRDILPPVGISPWTPRRKAFAAVAGCLLAAAAGYGIRAWRLRVVPPPPPPDPTWVALSALRKLEGAEGEVLPARDFAAAVAGVLRVFLEARHGLAAPRQTTEEFLEGLAESNRFLLPVREQLRLFLRSCDELKFAGVHTTGRARTELVSAAVRMIEEGLA